MYLTSRYTRVAVIPGETYTCGCDVPRYTSTVPSTCRTHQQPIARAAGCLGHSPNCQCATCIDARPLAAAILASGPL